MKPNYRLLLLPLLAAGIAFSTPSSSEAGSRPIRGIASLADTFRVPLVYERDLGPTSIGHSHNDFAQQRPLDEALEAGYSSVEVDVTDRGGTVSVVHLGLWTFGTLKEMYLDRLQRLVDEKGTVYGDGKKFTLWIEMRTWITGAAVVPYLRKLLAAYPMFAVFDKSGKVLRAGPVEAVLINNYSRDFFVGKETAPACLGTSGINTSSEPNEPFECWNYLNWSRHFSWDGKGEMPAEDRGRLASFQKQAHSRGLRTRYWGVPDTPTFWERARFLPFDIVNADHLKKTMEILRHGFTGGMKSATASER